MIITCEQCQTQFQLDDSRIPERGARVRCSRCEHAFFVKPASDAGDPVDHAVERALVEDEEHQSGSTQEPDPAVAPRGEADAERDWKFNDESSDLEPDLGDGESPGPEPGLGDDERLDLAPDLGDGESSGLAPDLGDDESLDLAPDLGADESPDLEPDLTAAREAVDDLLGAVDEGPLQEGGDGPLGAASGSNEALDEELDEGLGEELDEGLAADLGEDVDEEIDSLLDSTGYGDEPAEPEPAAIAAEEREAPVSAPTADQAAEEELGSPENWDFFSEEQDGSLPEEAGSERMPIARIPLAPAPTLERPPVDVDAEPSKTGQRLSLIHI